MGERERKEERGERRERKEESGERGKRREERGKRGERRGGGKKGLWPACSAIVVRGFASHSSFATHTSLPQFQFLFFKS
jgi:hypothetical protein